MRIAYLNPYRNSAENQIFRSMREAASKIGVCLHDCRNEVDIYACDPAFVVSVSSQVPKMTHHQTYLTVHEPKSHIFDLDARFRNVLSYDGYLTISDSLARFVRDFSYGVGRSEEPGFFYLTPQKSDLSVDWAQVIAAKGRQVAYFGTNWRRRMPILMEALDAMDILRIHGPRASWENQNFRSYRGPVAFDGLGPQQVYADCGIGLVIMDEKWVREDVISNRIFEISSVGAVSICPDIPWIRKWFGDSVLYYDADRSPFEIAEQIRSHYQFCLTSPDQAIAKAAAARSVFETSFSAEKMLENLVAFHAQKTELRKVALSAVGPQADITVIVRCGGRDAATVARAVDSIRDQTFGQIQILFAKYRDIDLSAITGHGGAVVGHDTFLIPGGSRATMLYEALRRVKTTYFAVLDDDDQWLPDHFESLFAAGRRVSPDFDAAFSGQIDIDHPVDIDSLTQTYRAISKFGHREVIRNGWDLYVVIHLSSLVARRDLLTRDLIEVPDMQTAEDSLLVGLLSRRSKPVFSYRATFLYSMNSAGGSNWETDVQRIEDEISLTLRANLALSPRWIAGGEMAGAINSVMQFKPRIGRTNLGEHINRVTLMDLGWRTVDSLCCPPESSGLFFASQSFALASGDYLITLLIETDGDSGPISGPNVGYIDIFVDNCQVLLTTFEVSAAERISSYQFRISDNLDHSTMMFQFRSHGGWAFTILSIGLHEDRDPAATLTLLSRQTKPVFTTTYVEGADQAQSRALDRQEEKRGMKKSFKKFVNSSGFYVSSMKSQRSKEERLLEWDALFARALDRDKLAAEKDRLAAELSDLTSERDILFDERNAYYLERNALQTEKNALLAEKNAFKTEKNALYAETEHLFGMVLNANSGGSGKAQLNQDVLALIVNGFKTGGFFVEFGATNGLDLSNTYLLEKDYGWTGILAEPATMWHEDLPKNRRCLIDTDCVWSVSGETLDFDMVEEGEFSTLSRFAQSDRHLDRREAKTTVKVKTISLMDLLAKHDAPKQIDYLSVDTEGSEYDILKTFDFDAYRFNLISVEHNYTDNRDRLKALLEANGYRRIFEHLSRWDDWYVPAK